ncbi:MAG: NUDIX hydrolase [Patescibacteria group bacterium]|jgi:8-oxo-dGTP diphosphatase
MAIRKPPRGVAASVAVYSASTGSFLMIQRKWDPDKGKWAFPGGYMEVDQETLEQAGVRELKEETGVEIAEAQLKLMHVLSDPKRDPRGHVVDVGYFVRFEKEAPGIGSDETRTKWITVDVAKRLDFALGHRQMFDEAMKLI